MPPKHPSAHSWETNLHQWEALGPGDIEGWADGDDTDFEEEFINHDDQCFIDHMLGLYYRRSLSAKDLCIAMYYAGRSGVDAAVQFGKQTDSPSGHFQRHLDPLLGYKAYNTDLYHVDLPTYNKKDASRCLTSTPMLLPHELLAREMGSDPSLGLCLDEMKHDLPDCYCEHPLVSPLLDNDQLPIPIAIYLDAVPYSQTDSVIGFWLENLVSGRRHLFCTLRKKRACACGCRGWCTLVLIFRVLAWSLDVLAKGQYPTTNHAGEPWTDADPQHRRDLGGTKLKHTAVDLFVKGDWSEFVTSLGFPAWRDGVRPCFCCNAFDDLYETADCDPLGLRWRENQDPDYFDACNRCEVKIQLNRRQHSQLVEHLKYDKRKHGSRGRTVMCDIPDLGIKTGDRLEVGADVVDVGKFDVIDSFPISCIFWRPANETLTRHRNPLFDFHAGISPLRSLALDTLHIVYLGIMNVYCRVAVWYLLQSPAFAGPGATDEALQTAVMAFAFELQEFYKTYAKAHPEEVLTRCTDFTMKMVGTRDGPKLKTKGGETFGILIFVLELLDRYKAKLDHDGIRLQRAGKAMLNIIRVWQSASRRMKTSEVQDTNFNSSWFAKINFVEISQVHEILVWRQQLADIKLGKSYGFA